MEEDCEDGEDDVNTLEEVTFDDAGYDPHGAMPQQLPPLPPPPNNEVNDLQDLALIRRCIKWKSVECKNEKSIDSILKALKKEYRDDDDYYVESDVDNQLLVHIPFHQIVKPRFLILRGPPKEGPKTVKLFNNKDNLDFSNITQYPPDQTITTTIENLQDNQRIALQSSKFSNTRSLTLYFEDNQGGADCLVTKLQKLAIFGTLVQTTEMDDYLVEWF